MARSLNDRPEQGLGDLRPAGVTRTPYHSTPVFDENTLPAALRAEHSTKAGVWGVIRVLEGHLLYAVLDPPSAHVLTPDNPGLILPQQEHFVMPLWRMRCQVDLYDAPPEL